MENHLTISKAAKKIGVSTETLRRWDKTGKFPSQRHPINNYRVYNDEQIEFVIKELQQKYLTDYANSLQYQIKPFFENAFGKRPEFELFDVIKDPGCMTNLVDHPDYKTVKDELNTQLFDYLKSREHRLKN